MTEHKHAAILRAIADGEPIENFEVLLNGWEPLAEYCSALLDKGSTIRRKPRTIRIGQCDVPEPLREAPKCGDLVWLADVASKHPTEIAWKAIGEYLDYWLDIGVLHSTREAAQAHIDALLSFTRTDK